MTDDRGIYERLVPGGIPVRPVLADDPAQARELPRRVRQLRHRRGGALRRPRRQAPAQATPGIVRHRGKIEAAIANAKAAAELDVPLAELVWSHAPTGRRRAPRTLADAPGAHARVDRAVQGAQAARLPLRRPDDRLRGRCRRAASSTTTLPAAGCGPRWSGSDAPLSCGRGWMNERSHERLITYDTSTLEGMQSAAGFVKGWLEARDVEVTGAMHNGRPVLAATVGPADGADGHPARPPRRGARPPGAVLAARRRRPALRPRRLRHEGRARVDDARRPRPGRAGARARALRLRVRRGVRGGRRSAAPTTWSSRATSATSRSPASPPTCTSASRPRACSRCASR